MDREVAERVVPTLLRAAGAIASTIDIVAATESAEESKRYADAVGEVMFA